MCCTKLRLSPSTPPAPGFCQSISREHPEHFLGTKSSVQWVVGSLMKRDRSAVVPSLPQVGAVRAQCQLPAAEMERFALFFVVSTVASALEPGRGWGRGFAPRLGVRTHLQLPSAPRLQQLQRRTLITWPKSSLAARAGCGSRLSISPSHRCQQQPRQPARAGLAQPRLPSRQYRESPGRVAGVSGDG